MTTVFLPSVITDDPALLALLSGLLGVAVTVIAGFVGAFLQARREHSMWKRDQRLKAYGDFLASVDNFLGAAVRGDPAELPSVARNSLTASSLIKLLGPDDVYAAAERLQEATRASIVAFESNAADIDQVEDARLGAREAYLSVARRRTSITR